MYFFDHGLPPFYRFSLSVFTLAYFSGSDFGNLYIIVIEFFEGFHHLALPHHLLELLSVF
jgi:hypothetical protein